MALIKCKECGAAVAASASGCPQCGAKMPPKTSMVTKVIAGLLFVGVLGAIFGGSKDPATKPVESAADAAARKAEAERFSLAKATAKGVQQSLRDPDSLKFRALGVNTEATVACGQYQAKNGFGGMNQAAVIVVNMKPVAFSEAAWKKHCTGLIDYLHVAS